MREIYYYLKNMINFCEEEKNMVLMVAKFFDFETRVALRKADGLSRQYIPEPKCTWPI